MTMHWACHISATAFSASSKSVELWMLGLRQGVTDEPSNDYKLFENVCTCKSLMREDTMLQLKLIAT